MFVHLSDIHLGHRQYGLKERRKDMYKTFNSTVSQIIEEDPQFVLISGDLFHNKNVNALALRDAVQVLTKLDEADIPVIAIQGNHDSTLRKKDLTWMEYLHENGKLILLESGSIGDGPHFEEHDSEEPGRSSGYFELNGVRIFGLEWLGQHTEEYIEEVAEAIDQINQEEGEPDHTVLLGHFGIEGYIPTMSGGISTDKLRPLKEKVDYLGLGHIHNKYSHGNWIYNPGSLEAHSKREAKTEHGYYLVETEDGLAIEFKKSKRRPYHAISFQVEGHDSPHDFETAFKETVEEGLSELEEKQQKPWFMQGSSTRKPMVNVRLEGLLEFSRSQLDFENLEDIIEENIDALHIKISDATDSKEAAGILQDLDKDVRDEDGQIDRNKLETAVFQSLVDKDSRYTEESDEVAETISTMKKNVLSGESSESIAENVKKKRRKLFPSKEGDEQ